jgi:hypothetical protein
MALIILEKDLPSMASILPFIRTELSKQESLQ